MESTNVLTVAGWVIVFLLGIASSIIVSRLTQKKKVLAWAVIVENDIVPKELSKTLGTPVQLTVGSETPSSIATCNLRFGNIGNEVVKKVPIRVGFPKGSKILNVRYEKDPGALADLIKWTTDESTCTVHAEFLNPRMEFELQFLVSDYELETVEVAIVAPGVECRRRDPGGWDLPTSVVQSFALSIMGVRYDPSIRALNGIAEELKVIRRSVIDR